MPRVINYNKGVPKSADGSVEFFREGWYGDEGLLEFTRGVDCEG